VAAGLKRQENFRSGRQPRDPEKENAIKGLACFYGMDCQPGAMSLKLQVYYNQGVARGVK
jgi:hypothetical protein